MACAYLKLVTESDEQPPIDDIIDELTNNSDDPIWPDAA